MKEDEYIDSGTAKNKGIHRGTAISNLSTSGIYPVPENLEARYALALELTKIVATMSNQQRVIDQFLTDEALILYSHFCRELDACARAGGTKRYKKDNS